MTYTENQITEHFAADMLKSIPEALIFADLQGIIQVWNQGAEAIFGFTAEEARGKSLDLIIPERLRQAHWDGYNKAIAHGNTLSGKGSRITRSLHKNEQQLYVDMSFAMVKDDTGQLIGSIAVARDATEKFLAEKNLRKQIAELSVKS